MTLLFWLALPVLVFALVWRSLRRDARLEVEQWVNHFPGKCLICGYHRYGIGHGFIDPGEAVEPHHCCEVSR